MGFIQEFRDFAVRGNVIDLAVGVIIGGAFGKIVDSVINDLIMPLVGKAIGNVDFTSLYVTLSNHDTKGMSLKAARDAGAAVFAYGSFITVVINFIILAFCIFIMVKAINTLKKKEAAKPAAPAPTPQDVLLLTEIRDLLRNR
ncbi:MAG: large conductance mechanosensitive channel protein MscL [Planctomycetota bacterium]|nr:large conductance mechanosensitive channel protein MscL [Planctomycetota bacterium]